MLQTGDIREELQAAFPHADLHSIDCDCGHCQLSGDPIRARHERFVRIQAAVLGAAIVAFYAMALFLLPQIAAALAPRPDRIEISQPATVGVAGPATRGHR
jgi:hypothetical protein